MPTDEITPIEIGQAAPEFTLSDVLSGVEITLSDLGGDVIVLNFWSADCPWSRHYDTYFAERGERWKEKGVRLLHVASNANEPINQVEEAAHTFDVMQPILHDPANRVADAFGATMTPHVFVITANGLIAYQGAVDDRNFRQEEATVNYLDAAVSAVLAGKEPDPSVTPAYGCTIVRSFDED